MNSITFTFGLIMVVTLCILFFMETKKGKHYFGLDDEV